MKRFLISLLLFRCAFAVPIDVIIPAVNKDLVTLEKAIESVKRYGKDVRRVIVISRTKLSDNAEWCSEAAFPFSKDDVAEVMGVEPNFPRIGWYYQQLLKLYAPKVIDQLSEQFVSLDADTVFLNNVIFVDENGVMQLNVGEENVIPYHEHAKRLWPSYRKVYPEYSGISNYMVFDTKILDQLFVEVEELHGESFYKAFIRQVDPNEYAYSGASEFEIYFNYALIRHPEKVQVTPLKWRTGRSWRTEHLFKDHGYHFMTIHAYLRGGYDHILISSRNWDEE